jgi:hypothetical protein
MEAVILSPLVFDSFLNDLSISSVNISESEIETIHFSFLQRLVRGEAIVVKKEMQRPLMKICSHLGNVDLEKYVFNLWSSNSDSNSDSDSNSNQDSESRWDPRAATLSDAALTDARRECALNFAQHSDEEISWLSQNALESILSDAKVRVQSEDWVFEMILSQGRDPSLFEYVQFGYLSLEGILHFVREFSFNDITEAIWLSVLKGIETIRQGSRESKGNPRSTPIKKASREESGANPRSGSFLGPGTGAGQPGNRPNQQSARPGGGPGLGAFRASNTRQ